MKQKITSVIAAVLILSTLLCSCNPGTSEDTATNENTQTAQSSDINSSETIYPYTFTDSLGNEITLEEKPETVAVMFSSFADIWKTAGGEINVTVGESVERGFADSGVTLIDEGSGHSTIDNEILINAEPDLVIGTTDYECQVSTAELCRNAGIPSASFKVESFDDYLGVLKIFCYLTGETERYEKYGVEVGEEIKNILADAEQRKIDSPKILFIRAGSSAKSTKAKNTDDNFACRMLSELGCTNIADTDTTLSAELSLEAIIEENPEYMFITTMGSEEAAKDYMNSLLETEGWRELDCVKSGKYYFLPKDLFHFKPNARWAEAYSYLADILYPNSES